MEGKHDYLHAIVTRCLNMPGLRPTQMRVLKFTSVSNEVFKVTFDDSVVCPQIESNSIVIKVKIEDSPHNDYILYAKEVSDFVKLHRFGPRHIYEDEVITIEEFISSTTCKSDDFIETRCLFPVIRSTAEYAKLFIDHSSDLKVQNPGKILLSLIIEGGIFEKVHNHLGTLINSAISDTKRVQLSEILNFVRSGLDMEEIRKELAIANGLPLIMCHNDLHWGNVLKKTTGGYQLIDFEYSTFNPLGWDLVAFYVLGVFVFDKQAEEYIYTPQLPSIDEVRLVYKFYLLCMSDGFDSTPAVNGQMMFDIARGKYDACLDMHAFEKLVQPKAFLGLVYLCNLQLLLLNCMMIKDVPNDAAIGQYALNRMDMHRRIREALHQTKA